VVVVVSNVLAVELLPIILSERSEAGKPLYELQTKKEFRTLTKTQIVLFKL
jgi:hypothetical protein